MNKITDKQIITELKKDTHCLFMTDFYYAQSNPNDRYTLVYMKIKTIFKPIAILLTTIDYYFYYHENLITAIGDAIKDTNDYQFYKVVHPNYFG